MTQVQICLIVPFAEYLLDEEDRSMKFIPHVIEHMVCHKIILFRKNSVYNAFVDQIQTCYQFVADSELQANTIIEKFYQLDFMDQNDQSLSKQLLRIDGEYFYSRSELADKIWEKLYDEKDNDMIGGFHSQKFIDDLCKRCVKYYKRYYRRNATKLFVKYENRQIRPQKAIPFGDTYYIPQNKTESKSELNSNTNTQTLLDDIRTKRQIQYKNIDRLRGQMLSLELTQDGKLGEAIGSVLVFDQAILGPKDVPSAIVQYSVFVLFFYFMRVSNSVRVFDLTLVDDIEGKTNKETDISLLLVRYEILFQNKEQYKRLLKDAGNMFVNFYNFYKIYFIDEGNYFVEDIERIAKSMLPDYSPFFELTQRHLKTHNGDLAKYFSQDRGAMITKMLEQGIKFEFNSNGKQRLPDLNIKPNVTHNKSDMNSDRKIMFLGNVGSSQVMSKLFIRAKIEQQQFVNRNLTSDSISQYGELFDHYCENRQLLFKVRIFYMYGQPINIPLFMQVVDSMMFFFAKEKVLMQLSACNSQNFVVLEIFSPHEHNVTILPHIFKYYKHLLKLKDTNKSKQLQTHTTTIKHQRSSMRGGFGTKTTKDKNEEIEEMALFNKHDKKNQIVFLDFINCEQVALTMETLLLIDKNWIRYGIGIPHKELANRLRAPQVQAKEDNRKVKIVYILPLPPSNEYFHSLYMRDMIFLQIQQIVSQFNRALSGEIVVMSNLYSVYGKARKGDNFKISLCSIQSAYVNIEDTRRVLKYAFDMFVTASNTWNSTKQFVLNNTKTPWTIKKILTKEMTEQQDL